MRTLLLTAALAAGIAAPAQADGYLDTAAHLMLAKGICGIPVPAEFIQRAVGLAAIEHDATVDEVLDGLELMVTLGHANITQSPGRTAVYCGYVLGALSQTGAK